tara:strand:+ start:1196 stop:1507 length:312 start_codon:yes stop_codon:yes gene_type:complete
MDAKQKYTEEEFEIDEFFIEQMQQFKKPASIRIASLVDKMYGIESTDGQIRNKTGHVHLDNKEPVFFAIDYYRDNEGPIVLMDVYNIEVDQYLDSINSNLNIK